MENILNWHVQIQHLDQLITVVFTLPLGSLETTRLLIYTYFTVFTARTEHLLLTGATGA